MRKSALLFLVAAGALFLFSLNARGQTFYGSIVGTVMDASGAVVPDANVTLTNLGTDQKRTIRSDSTGLYQFLNLVVGSYRVEVEKEGFKHFIRGPLTVEVQNVLRIDISMQVGALTQTVEVTAATPMLQPETSSLGQVVVERTVQDLPVNGRNPLSLVALVPGVVPGGYSQANAATNNFTAWGNFSIGGAQLNQSEVLWDNMPQSLSILNGVGFVPTEDAVAEFKVQTNNFQAEFSHTAGGVINLTTKTGSNKIHGGAYEFVRNNVFDANTFFNNASGVSIAPLRQNQFGVTFGGPVTIPHVYNGKDKTFVFGSWEGFRQRLGQSLLASVPSQAEHQGDFSGLKDTNGNVVPIYDPTTTIKNPSGTGYIRQQVQCQGALNVMCPTAISPSGADFAKLWPLPNTSSPFKGTDVNNWAGNGSVANNADQVNIRVDEAISDKQRFMTRYSFYRIDTPGLDIWKNKTALFDNAAPQSTTINDVVAEDTYTFTPTTILQARYGYLRFGFTRTPASLGQDLTQYGFPASLNTEVEKQHIPVVEPQGITPLSDSTGSAIWGAQETHTVGASLTKVRGRSTWKFGTEMRWYRVSYTQTNNASGLFSFDNGFTSQDPTASPRVGGYGFASMLEGYPASGGSSLQLELPLLSFYRGFYAQNDIRVSNKLTLNLGLRYDMESGYTERHDRLSFWMPDSPSPLASPAVAAGINAACMSGGVSICSGPINPQLLGRYGLVASGDRPDRHMQDTFYKEFAPRVGFAYRALDKTVIRGGFGIYWLPNHLMVNMGTNQNPIAGIGTNYVASHDNGLTPASKLDNPFPTGIVQAPGRDPSYQNTILDEGGGGTLIPGGQGNHTGYTEQWNFNIQQELPKEVLLDIAYAGNRGVKVPMYWLDLQQIPLQFRSLRTALNDQLPNPFYGLIASGPLAGPTVARSQLLSQHPQYTGVGLTWPYAGKSIYNAMQLKIDKRFKGGSSILVAYTVSKLISDTDSQTSWLQGEAGGWPQNFYNRRAERSLSSYDIPQRMVISYSLDLPFGHGKKLLGDVHGPADKIVSGWAINGITTLQSGMPIWVGAQTASRPDSTGKSAHLSGSALGRLNEWFNTSVFTQPDSYNSFGGGNVSRTLPDTRVEGQKNFDFSLFKNTYFGPDGKLDLQFRAEFFNLFNRVQFGYPGNTLGNAGFGVISSQLNEAREIQLGMKFIF